MEPVEVTHFTDPGCPWAYSASPALAALRWRFGSQLRWRLVLIGLTERAEDYARRGYTPMRQAVGLRRFRIYGMPFAPAPRPRVAGTSRACRAIVAARMISPELGDEALRALQFMQFTTPLVLDEDEHLAEALSAVPGLDAREIVARIDDPEVIAAYEADRALARTAAGSPTEWQGKAAATDGPVRYTAPSLIFEHHGVRLEAGGFQPIEAYDVVLANLCTDLVRRPPAEDPVDALREEPRGLTTAEVAEIMRPGLLPADRDETERRLLEAAVEGRAVRVPLGDDALWLSAEHARERLDERQLQLAALD